ncbi:MAG: preprotein translocase subunit SecE [Clostridia bacterium]|jgi:preprotein translocase subunit SecE|nr:preprotein translocase subunit SecE [Clostridia bacterium]
MADLEKKEVEATEVAENTKKEKSKKAAPKKNKVSLGKRISKFFKDYKSELKKVVWLSPKTTAQYTGMILVVMVVVSAFIGVLDLAFHSLLMWLSGLV